jgi:hypothetical protein
MASRVLALVEHPASEMRPTREPSSDPYQQRLPATPGAPGLG